MNSLLEDARSEIEEITAGLSQVRTRSRATKMLKDGEWVDPEESPPRHHSMFPYRSTAMMCHDLSEIPAVTERLRKEGVIVDFDRSGRPEITSTKQQGALAKALGLKTGRDGYGHMNEHRQFQNSGRRRADEVAEGQAKVRKVIETLETMPDDAAPAAVAGVLGQCGLSSMAMDDF